MEHLPLQSDQRFQYQGKILHFWYKTSVWKPLKLVIAKRPEYLSEDIHKLNWNRNKYAK